MADDGETELLATLRLEFGQVEGLLVALGAVGIESGGDDHPPFPVVVPQQQVKVHQGGDVVEAVGVLGRAAVDIDAGLAAVGGELFGYLFDDTGVDAAELGVLGDRHFPGGFLHDLQRALHLERFPLLVLQFGGDEEVTGHGVLVVIRIEGDRLAVLHGHQVFEAELFAVLVLAGLLFLQADLLGPQEGARLSLVIQLHQPAAVTPGGILVDRGSGLVGGSQVGGVVALVLQNPAGHPHGEGGVAPRLDRHPAIGF